MGSPAGLVELLGTASGGFYAPVRYFVQIISLVDLVGSSAVVADVNGDGRPDVVIPDDGVVGVFLNAGGLTRQATSVTLTSSQNPSLVVSPPTLTASVTPTGLTLQGSVTFYIDGQAVYVLLPAPGRQQPGEVDPSSQASCCPWQYSSPSLSIGTHSIVAIYSGDSNTQGSTSATFTQVVSPIATATTLSSSLNPSETGQTVTFTATIAATNYALAVNQGTVTFFDGSNVLGTVPVTLNTNNVTTAALGVSNLTAGTQSITASYSGGGNFGGSTSPPLQQVVNGNVNLVISSGGSSSATVAAGTTAQYSLTIGDAGFNGQTTVSCSGAPTGATCTVSPSNLMVSATTATPLTVSLTTARTSASLRRLRRMSGWVWAVFLFGFLALPHDTRRALLKSKLVLILLFPVLLVLSSCGGSSGPKTNPNGTPAGTYKILVQATSGSLTDSISLSLTVE
jgi:hypothetical protein